MKALRKQKDYFTRELMNWHASVNNRSLPWKSEKDPYKIWLSEIILQQTRTAQGLPYYLSFTEAYPTLQDLANAKDEEVFRLWQGLGYYNRCKNMLATARYIVNDLKGRFPKSYEEIAALKGIGPYTAAAIASFAYGLSYAVVDGNVYRVLSRYFGIETPIDSTEGKKQFATLASELLDAKNSAAYNQAIMDAGATVCTPKKPDCENCPLHKNCVAYSQNLTELLPVKAKKLIIKHRYFNFILFTDSEKLWLHKRIEKDIWQSLYEPYLIEQPSLIETFKIKSAIFRHKHTEIPEYLGSVNQKLTHQVIHSHFYKMSVKKLDVLLPDDGIWVKFSELNNYPFPKTILSFLKKIFYF